MSFRKRFRSLQMVPAALLLVTIATVTAGLFSYRGAAAAQIEGELKALHGIQEFMQSGTFKVPDGVSAVLVEAYGGGGASGTSASAVGEPAVGGAGGAGAFSRSVIRVIPGSTLTVTVGAGGLASPCCPQQDADGGDGGDSSVSFHGVTLISAFGGKGGTSPPNGGKGGAGGAADPSAMISHAGQNGGDVSASTAPGAGYQPIGMPVSAYAANAHGYTVYVGAVSAGGASSQPGQPGYVLLTY